MLYSLDRPSENISRRAVEQEPPPAPESAYLQGKPGRNAAGEEEFKFGEFSQLRRTTDGQRHLAHRHRSADSQGYVYVTDEWLNRVSVFDADGSYQRHFSTVQEGDPEANGSCGIAISADDELFITDGRSHKVRKFTTGGQYLGSFGSQGSGEGEFDSPWGITIDKEGYVYVADSGNHRVQKLTQDGEFVAQIGRGGNKRGELHYPSDVAVDPEGDVYVCDWSDNRWAKGRVHIFDADGKFLTSLVGDAQQLSHWAQMTVDANADYAKRRREVRTTEPEWTFAQPTGVEYDAENNRLIVADTQRSRVQIYNKVSRYLIPQLNL